VSSAPLGIYDFNGSAGAAWDTRSYDVSSFLAAAATNADALLSSAGDGLVWVAAILSVPASSHVFTPMLTVGKLGIGQGSVTSISTPPTAESIDCGQRCSVALPSGTSVTLSATPLGGSTFLGWSHPECVGAGTCTLTLARSETVAATFAPPPLTNVLRVNFAGSGSGTVLSDPPGIDCIGSCSAQFQSGESVTLTATSASDSTFTGWSGDGCGETSTCVVSLTAARTVTATFLLAPSPTPSLSLYDDFSVDQIDARKWQNLEVVREIRDGRLALKHRAAGPAGTSVNNLQFANPTAIQSFQADVRLTAFQSPVGGASRVGLRGTYYNDGTGGPGSIGNVHAQLYLSANSADGADIAYNVFKCTNDACTTSATVIPTTTIKSVRLAEAHTLAIAWSGSLFTFTVDGQETVVNPADCTTYPTCQAVVSATPTLPEKVLRSYLRFGGAGGEGLTAADCDNVRVNGELYDDFGGPPFSGPRLDPARWASLELVREVVDGKLVSKAATAGARVRNMTRFTNQKAITAARATMTVTAYDSVNNGRLQARPFAGAYYNDGSSTGGSDMTGDINAYVLINSDAGAPLTVRFMVTRCGNSSCGTEPSLFTDALGAINANEPHSFVLLWDGSVFTYGMDAITRAYDPRAVAPVLKPPVTTWKDVRTDATAFASGAHYGYIAATFDDFFVNEEASALPVLAAFREESVAGDVTSAGVGLRGVGSGTINMTGVPEGATVAKAYLYWATLGTAATFSSPSLNGTAVAGTLIGRADDPAWGAQQSYAFRADVTSLVAGNGAYTISGLPGLGPTINDTEGASLVVIYTRPGAAVRKIVINDGAVMLHPSLLSYYQTNLNGFTAAAVPAGSSATFIVADGQTFTPEYAGLNTTLLSTNAFSGSDGNHWDTRSYDVSSALGGAATTANAALSTVGDSLIWIAAILGVSQEQTLLLAVLKTGNGTVASSPAGIDCGANCGAAFSYGTPVVLTASPAAGSLFVGWSGDGCSGTTAPCTVNMTQARAVTALFGYPITVTLAGSGMGTVREAGGGITCPGDCSEEYPAGTQATLTATPDPGASFREWRGGCTGTSPTVHVSMTDAQTCVAVFSTPFTDSALAGAAIKAVHFIELREAINTLRSRRTPALPPFNWIDAAPAAGGAVRASHLADLRSRLDEIQTQTYLEPTIAPHTTTIKAGHIGELRDKVRNLE
jgi:hypothetical protein